MPAPPTLHRAIAFLLLIGLVAGACSTGSSDRIEYRANVGNDMVEHEVVDLFLAEAPSDLKLVPNPDEVMDTRWIDLYDLSAEVGRWPERFTPWLRIYLDKHRDRIFGTLVRA